ncbi:carbamoyl phosphate synthase large subunit [Candidatus Roizmanbacteria bacterium CG22_combo_CG10-13_8_21_14_all_38_20]|uniref:Carbamoyl phosphate synthase arginine-specific large chain n=1 Tax=Candidatus Roizmanbacteria bacterium CG22_combo_CG10-13_8_21_14_all_38_20 TaxID=1974862 RepID=A0A2H0BUU8_9BACT|nr:carbamoyl-phosphate synthase (glutamine-hydrolyzing) large subunit [Candidatus Microgenomates bacterium]PIP61374.1 MAG: carbamoyl phosphate synthase large subunit [Candidatus Roizmanbacteria bacterium CG22_combo_CG10-13_8_21_14_all_38_20]PJC31484.1 MAG: carbamoyl phosphate synthase large subunit [Candidatus Roizmanbacteria bacterium CG_4_9_14_0_2_um_filter_38_17]
MLKILILGSGALQIGQAGEFDYSGSQAIKAVKEEGNKVILVNPNIATIQTSRGLADKVYFLPVTPEFVTKVIIKEKPDAVMLAFGGQTALNCGLKLYRQGVFKKHNVKVLGTSLKTIEITEDRELFKREMKRLKLDVAISSTVNSIKQAHKVMQNMKYPVMLRSAFALGGLGSAVVYNKQQLDKQLKIALSQSKQVLVEEYLGGWKEIEYEVIRDANGNKVTICNMENMDPMGIHTGESIVVAPSQTLTNDEYFGLRRVSLDCIEGLGIIGECNIQFAFNPHPKNSKLDYRIIEVNARLSRSSALASKATGYPLAFVAAKIGLGKTLPEIKNAVTKTTTAFFEPALDYLVVKIPRWDLNKFDRVNELLGSEMKSVGEVMAIGRTFPEAIQKAVRMLDIGYSGVIPDSDRTINYEQELANPTPERLFLISQALMKGMSPEKIANLSKIDIWFIYQIQRVVKYYMKMKSSKQRTPEQIKTAKKLGFSDNELAKIFNLGEDKIRLYRKKHSILPVIKKIDTLAGEFPAETNYLYMTYNGNSNDVARTNRKSVGILGGGPYRIGSSVEFDWCAVSACWEFKKRGYSTVMLNCNPETVSTDYDISDRLYFDELTFERALDIAEYENIPLVVSVGGQTPNNLALKLKNAGISVLGTSPKDIDRAEDRHKFSKLLDKIKVLQPAWAEVKSRSAAVTAADKIGYPVLMRPSYVLSGQAMFVAFSEAELNSYLDSESVKEVGYPLTMSKYYLGYKETDVDGVASCGGLLRTVILEHVENAGVHSGDASLVYPSPTLPLNIQQKIVRQTARIAKELRINGPFNIQFLVSNQDIRVIECNLRTSRSFPFSSKVTNSNLISFAVKAMIENKVGRGKDDIVLSQKANFTAVKVPQFSFSRLRGADPVLKVEMASTGEAASFASNLHEAFLKAVISTEVKLPSKAALLSLGGYHAKRKFLTPALLLQQIGFKLYATGKTCDFLAANGLNVTCVYKIYEKKQPDVPATIIGGMVDLVINTSEMPDVGMEKFKKQTTDGYLIRRAAIDHGVPLITDLHNACLFVESLALMRNKTFEINSWDEYLDNALTKS